MRILVTGSRNWSNAFLIERTLAMHAPFLGPVVTLVHGDCPTGADALAADFATSRGWTVEAHPADWEKHGKAAGPIRNQEMVDQGADICIAFLMPDSRGTRDCARRAREAGISVVQVHGQ